MAKKVPPKAVNLFEEGMSEYDVMKLAGHADFETTHKFYLRVRDDLVHRARQATARGLCQNLLQNCCNCLVNVEKH